MSKRLDITKNMFEYDCYICKYSIRCQFLIKHTDKIKQLQPCTDSSFPLLCKYNNKNNSKNIHFCSKKCFDKLT